MSELQVVPGSVHTGVSPVESISPFCAINLSMEQASRACSCGHKVDGTMPHLTNGTGAYPLAEALCVPTAVVLIWSDVFVSARHTAAPREVETPVYRQSLAWYSFLSLYLPVEEHRPVACIDSNPSWPLGSLPSGSSTGENVLLWSVIRHDDRLSHI